MSERYLSLALQMDMTEEVLIGAKASKVRSEEGLGRSKSSWKMAADPTDKVLGPVKLTVGLSLTVWNNIVNHFYK